VFFFRLSLQPAWQVSMPPHSVFSWAHSVLEGFREHSQSTAVSFCFVWLFLGQRFWNCVELTTQLFISSSCCAKVLGGSGNQEQTIYLQCWWTSTSRNMKHS
jgi:hypothetical protein